MRAFDRRTFLASAAAAAQAQTPPRKIRIAFLGASHSHAHDKIVLAAHSPDWDLAGIVEDNAQVREPFTKLGIRTLFREDALRDPSIEVIAVESEVMRHAEDGLAALVAGKHVHLEKPPAHRMADMRRLVDAARTKKRLLQMGYMWRHHAGLNQVLNAARQGWLGDIYMVRGTMNTLIGPDRRPEWALFKGGQMFEQGAHILDPVVRLMGAPKSITPYLRSHGPYPDGLKDNTAVVLEYPKALAIVTSAVLQPDANPHRSFEVLGTNGTGVLRPIEPPRLEFDLAKAAGAIPAGRQVFPLPAFRRYEGDFRELAACVRDNKPLSVTLDQDLLLEEVLLTASEMI